MESMLIGIDPDVDKSGVAVIQENEMKLYNLTFFKLFDFLKDNTDAHVSVEGGWLNKSNWHKQEGESAAINARIGANTGANHETGKKIVEMLVYLNMDYEIIRPSKSKKNSQLFKLITKYKKRTNQEQRDAAMLIFGKTHRRKCKK